MCTDHRGDCDEHDPQRCSEAEVPLGHLSLEHPQTVAARADEHADHRRQREQRVAVEHVPDREGNVEVEIEPEGEKRTGSNKEKGGKKIKIKYQKSADEGGTTEIKLHAQPTPIAAPWPRLQHARSPTYQSPRILVPPV